MALQLFEKELNILKFDDCEDSKNIRCRGNFKFIKKLEIYEEIPELLSVSLGSMETTLLNLTAAYASFVNGGKNYTKFNFKNSRQKGKTILKARNKKCVGCDEFIDQKSEFP